MRLIDADALLKTINNPLHVPYITKKDVIDMPTAQPERKKGVWRHYEGYLYCSYCGQEFDDGIMEFCGDDVPRCCPECGADMRGEDDEVHGDI